MFDLGALIGRGNSFATGINSAGHVVGNVLIGDTHMSFIWRDNKMILHRSGDGLFLTNSINDSGQVIGATYKPVNGAAFEHAIDAATIISSAEPTADHGDTKLASGFLIMMLVIVAAVIIIRKRYRGVLFNG
jgi:uncharacterized membrane protein